MIATMRRRLYSRTMGLLEIAFSGNVRFLHRTVRDWVMRDDNLAAIRSDVDADFDPCLELIKARSTEFKCLELQWYYVPLKLPTFPLSLPVAAIHESQVPAAQAMGFWSMFAKCLQYAAHCMPEEGNSVRLLSMLEDLEDYTNETVRLRGYDQSDTFRMLNGTNYLPSWALPDQTSFNPHSMVRMAARSGVLPFLAARVNTRVFRRHKALFALLLNDAVFGHIQFVEQKQPGHRSLLCEPYEDVLSLVEDNRLRLVAHLLRVAPRTFANRQAIEGVGEQAEAWRDQRPVIRRIRYHYEHRSFLAKVLEVLQRELSPHVWMWRLCFEGVERLSMGIGFRGSRAPF